MVINVCSYANLNVPTGEKGSDASAREATRRMLAAVRQHDALADALMACTGALPEGQVTVQVQAEQWDSETPQKGAGPYRNTLVREALHEISRAPGRKSSRLSLAPSRLPLG